MENEQRLAFFEASGITVPLPERMYFHDEGPSKTSFFSDRRSFATIEGRSFEIIRKHELRYLTEKEGMTHNGAKGEAYKIAYDLIGHEFFAWQNLQGRCFGYQQDFGRGVETHIHILYLEHESPAVTIHTKAHEEYHAMVHIPGAVELLERKILDDRGQPLYFGRITNEELAADCNAVHAVTMHGFDPEEFLHYRCNQGSLARQFKRALYIYNQGEYRSIPFLISEAKATLANLLKK